MLKRKIITLLLSMVAFMAVFIYGSIQYMDKGLGNVKDSTSKEVKDALYTNVYITSGDGTKLTFFSEGILRTVETSATFGEKLTHTFGDITIKDGKVTKIKIKPVVVTGKVVSVSDSSIKVEKDNEATIYQLSKDFKPYRYNKNMGAVIEAKEMLKYCRVSFAQENGKVCAGIASDEELIDNIRVLIGTTGYKELLHDKVIVTCKTSFTIQSKNNKKVYKGAKKVVIKASDKRLKEGNLVVESNNHNSKIKLLSVKRNNKNPLYRGKIEISLQKGKIVVVNELPFEEYLYAVIPSEMPSSYPMEALKVQAVCARTYAYNQFLSDKFHEYGANIDDSVKSQVYNNISEDKNSMKAVKSTTGEILKYQDELLQTYYFSTSWGCTADAEDVWITNSSDALKGKLQDKNEAVESFSFSKESDFKKFLSNSKEKTYDSSFPWYRWSVNISCAKLQKSIEKKLLERYESNPSLIQVLQKNGTYESQKISSIGKIKEIKVINRCDSGLINELVVKGSSKTIKIFSEYNIRVLLAPEDSVIKRKDGSKIEGLSMLPSAFFTVVYKNGSFSFKGGGYGHGVGMSQNGANKMADSGEKYEDILQHYYSGATLYNLYV